MKYKTNLSELLESVKADDIDDLLEEETYLPTRVIKSESLTLRDKERVHGNKSKSKKARLEVY